jgi:uncharacterized lipoprotein YbaY
MNLKVDLVVAGKRPPAGTPVWVQLRDTSVADAPAVVLAEKKTVVHPGNASVVASVEFEFEADSVPSHTTVWARVAASGDMQHTQPGDFVTMASYPVGQSGRPLSVELKKV